MDNINDLVGDAAKHDYYGFLDYKEDRYTTVYGYMD